MTRQWRPVTGLTIREAAAEPVETMPTMVLVWGDGEVTLDRSGQRLHDYLLAQAYGRSEPDDTLANLYIVDHHAERSGLSPLGMPLVQVGVVHRNTANVGNDWLDVEYLVLKPGVDPRSKRGYQFGMHEVLRIVTIRVDGRA